MPEHLKTLLAQIESTGEETDIGTSTNLQAKLDYWYQLIDEGTAAEFIDNSKRTVQGYRQRGGGPRYIRISARCIRYRRIDLREWVEERIRNNTSQQEEENSKSPS